MLMTCQKQSPVSAAPSWGPATLDFRFCLGLCIPEIRRSRPILLLAFTGVCCSPLFPSGKLSEQRSSGKDAPASKPKSSPLGSADRAQPDCVGSLETSAPARVSFHQGLFGKYFCKYPGYEYFRLCMSHTFFPPFPFPLHLPFPPFSSSLLKCKIHFGFIVIKTGLKQY